MHPKDKRIQDETSGTSHSVEQPAQEASSESMSEESKSDSQESENKSQEARHSKRQKVEEEDTTQSREVVARPDLKRVRGRRGFLKYITEMPLDVVYEILRGLEPIDLLHLSWASKGLNAIVMNKSARFIWKDAFDRIYESNKPPPECPADLNFAQYARLLFGKRCMKCNIAIGRHTSWTFRLRVCSSCLQDCFLTRSECERYHAPFRYSGYHLDYFRHITAIGKVFYMKDEIEEYERKYRAPEQDTNSFADFRRHLQDEKREKSKDCEKYSEWLAAQARNRGLELQAVRSERRTMIYQRLNQLGWIDLDIERLTSEREAKRDKMLRITKNKPLTEKEWKNLSVKLVSMLEDARAKEEERKAQNHKARLLQPRYDALLSRYTLWRNQQKLDMDLLPFFQDLVLEEPLKSALFDNLDSEEISDFTVYDDVIRRLAEEWITERDAYLMDLLPEELLSSSPAGNKSEVLHLATVYFSCPNKFTHSYSQICAWRLGYAQGDTPSPQELIWLGIRRSWNLDRHNITFHQEAHDVAKGIVALCDADPASASTTYMNERCFKLRCLLCNGGPLFGTVNLFSWREAISHTVFGHDTVNNNQPDYIRSNWHVVEKKNI